MWKWGGSAPSGQARVSRPNWSQCAKSHAAWQSLSSRAEKLRTFSKKIFLFFDHFFLVLVIFLPFSRCWPYFEAGMLFDGFGRTRKAESNVGWMETPYFERLAGSWQIWPYSRYRGPDPLLGSASILKELISKIWQNLKQASKSLS